jgi:hypothetical protein
MLDPYAGLFLDGSFPRRARSFFILDEVMVQDRRQSLSRRRKSDYQIDVLQGMTRWDLGQASADL